MIMTYATYPLLGEAEDVVQNLANVGLPHLILGYKQTFTIIASQYPTIE